MSTMTLSEELQWRGFINQTTFDDITKLDEKKLKFYMGFDASADSQTVGNMAGMMFAKCFLRHGYEGVLLAGGSTSLIGDPGGKDKERPLQSEEAIAHNIECAKEQMKVVLKGQDFKLVNNLDWTKGMSVVRFLRDIGKHFSMTPLIQRDYIATRLGEGGAGISYTEFSYTILQGMDYLHLFDTEGVTLQLGGSDQWGNCLSGVELIRRARGAEVDVITLNLVINKATGKKFGKSEEGAVWLDAGKTSVYKFYQFWLNLGDEDVEYYLKIFTELDKPTIDGVIKEFQGDRAARHAQKTLAYEVTKLVHGQDQADKVKKITEALFGGANFMDLSDAEKDMLAQELPCVDAQEQLAPTLVAAGLAGSNSEAMRFMKDGAMSINGDKYNPDTFKGFAKGLTLVKRGKNNFAIVRA